MRSSLIFLATFFSFSLLSNERITSFESDVTIAKTGSLAVKETITVYATGALIKHGIIRKFPTRYRDRFGTSYVVDFEVKRVLLDGNPVEYAVKKEDNGEKIYIGNEYLFLKPGMYTYTIEYSTNRQIGFFKDHDELYWNVTGNGWRLRIDNARAVVRLPEGTPIESVEAATGYAGEQGRNYTASFEKNHAFASTTRPLLSGMGLSMTVAWPKGPRTQSTGGQTSTGLPKSFVDEPTVWQKTNRFLKDNWMIGLGILALLLIFLFAFYFSILQSRINAPGVVIPHYYPPEGMLPSAVGYLNDQVFNNDFVAADIVDLAVRGFIEITSEKSLWRRLTYILKQTTKTKDAAEIKALTEYERRFLYRLFRDKTSVVVGQANHDIIESLVQQTRNYTSKITHHDLTAFVAPVHDFDISHIGYVIAFLASLPIIPSLISGSMASYHTFLVVGLFVAAFFSRPWKEVYTPLGRRKQDHVDGFKMFLETTEIDRMKMIGTPPTKTPELYEKYLPYAMVLGLEDQWTKQFAPVFAERAQTGHPYQPRWYRGSSFTRAGFANNFASSLKSSFSSAIASSSMPPGRISGRGGGTRSGGGGGGGGGGGW